MSVDSASGRSTHQNSLVKAPDVNLSPAALGRKIADLEQKMLDHAKNLEFEEAASLRDVVTELKQAAFVS
tara:strand:- start:1524 stop:1733 length:210 start_codon:yes stop_codon:yes gene_type:complete